MIEEAYDVPLKARNSKVSSSLTRDLATDPHILLRMAHASGTQHVGLMCGGRRQSGAQGLARSYYICEGAVEIFLGRKVAMKGVTLDNVLGYIVESIVKKVAYIRMELATAIQDSEN